MQLTKIIDKKIRLENFVKEKSNITGITNNSKKAKPGMLFVAIDGNQDNGLSYIDEAVKRGIFGVLISNNLRKIIKLEDNINILRSDNIRLSSSKIARSFFPKQPKNIVAITGTNGKTSVSHYLKYIWHKNNFGSASIGTLGIKYDRFTKKSDLTTPDPIFLHEQLQFLKNRKIEYLALEASSHALHQHRLDSLNINFAVFTNLTRDHIDYHKNMENYFLSKKRLFSEILMQSGVAIINTDKKYGKLIKKVCIKKNIRYISYGFSKSDWQIKKIESKKNIKIVKFSFKNKTLKFSCKLIADYQIENLMAAIIVANLQGVPLKIIFSIIKNLRNPAGRLDQVKNRRNRDLSIFIDYAHSPSSLEESLRVLKKLKKDKGRLILIFGCGGDRDKGKRKMMSEIASSLADIIYITDDNPRNEDPNQIRKELSKYCRKSINIGDRKKAIFAAIKSMKEKDILLIAGKGHEKYQEIKGKKIPFSDKNIAQKALIMRYEK